MLYSENDHLAKVSCKSIHLSILSKDFTCQLLYIIALANVQEEKSEARNLTLHLSDGGS